MSFNTASLPGFCGEIKLNVTRLKEIIPHLESKSTSRVCIKDLRASSPDGPEVAPGTDNLIRVTSRNPVAQMKQRGFIDTVQNMDTETSVTSPEESINANTVIKKSWDS